MTRADSAIKAVADLTGKRIAATRGTDPHILLVRALQEVGLTEKDMTVVLLQHQDGKLALLRGNVDAWVGLDQLMASTEAERGAKLFYRKREANTWGVLNVREAFAVDNPGLVSRVLAVYEKARHWAIANPNGLKGLLVAATKLHENVIAQQLLGRTHLTHSRIGQEQKETIL